MFWHLKDLSGWGKTTASCASQFLERSEGSGGAGLDRKTNGGGTPPPSGVFIWSPCSSLAAPDGHFIKEYKVMCILPVSTSDGAIESEPNFPSTHISSDRQWVTVMYPHPSMSHFLSSLQCLSCLIAWKFLLLSNPVPSYYYPRQPMFPGYLPSQSIFWKYLRFMSACQVQGSLLYASSQNWKWNKICWVWDVDMGQTAQWQAWKEH